MPASFQALAIPTVRIRIINARPGDHPDTDRPGARRLISRGLAEWVSEAKTELRRIPKRTSHLSLTVDHKTRYKRKLCEYRPVLRDGLPVGSVFDPFWHLGFGGWHNDQRTTGAFSLDEAQL